MKYITTALLLLVLSSPAQAGISDSGNELLPACKLALDPPNNESRRQADDALYCSAFVRGYVSGWGESALNAANKSKPYKGTPYELGLYCIPGKVTTSQMIRIVVAYMERHPEELHKDPGRLIRFAINEAFPCTRT